MNIVIIGAGLSGLVSGYELSKHGHNITLLEARDRVGGRVYTVRNPFSNGNFAEAGASRIPSNHHYTLNYCEEFNIPLESFYPQTRQYAYLDETTRSLIGT